MSPLRLALLLLLVGLPLFVLADFHLFERSCRRAKKEDDGCFCVMHVSMSKCCCVGRQVKEIPTFRENLKFLFLHDVSLTNISATQFDNYTSLVELVISDSALEEVNAAAFDNLKSLMKISITNCPRLTTFNGTLLRTTPRLQSVVVKYTGLERSPSFEMLPDSGSRTVDVIDFSHNRLEYLESGLMKNVKAKTVRFNDNNLQAVGEDVFQDCQFVSLYLNDNEELSDISPDVFRNILEIQNLNMSNTAITILPTNGLTDKIQTLTLIKTHDLKVMPQVLTLTELHIAQFTYPYHCCLFKYASRILTNAFMDNKKIVVRQDCVRRFVGDKKMLRKRAIEAAVTTQASRKARNGDEDAFLNNLADWLKMELQEFQENSEENDTISDSGALDPVEFDTFADLPVGSVQVLAECESEIFEFDWTVNVTCTPQGDELNPCEDLVGYFWLRWVIWIMWTVGVVMNIVVLCFLWNIKQRNLRLHYFFMMNLSFADLLTGIYLAMLAIMDIRSSSQYYNYALDWQTGWGCWIAGFLSVLASELSIISMFLLAFEMWYNAKYAFFGKKMGPKLAYGLMFGGYIFSFTMAIGPWFGVSSYETSSICLPLSIDSIVDQAYLVVGLVFNSVAFIGVIMCYIMISFMLCNPNTPSRDEDTHIIAKMAILIGTDMACWMPTLFFGLTAALNHPLISLTNAKVFLIVFYPINSLCNPVLYCLATKVAKNKVQTKIKKFKQLQIHRSSVDWLKSFGSEKHLPKLNHFYHSNPPSERSSIPNGYDPSAKLLFITNPNSPDHTPRGSAGSITPTPRSPNPDDQEEFMPPKRNSIVSFQETVLVHSDNSMFTKRKSMGSIRQKVSAIPEMSDISENISENSAVSQPNAFPDEVYFPKRKAPRRASLQLVSKFIRSRRSKNRSIGADSGRGSSVTSTSSLLNVPFQKERVSLTSADSCFTDDRGSFELTSFGSGSGSDTSSSSPPKIRNTKTPSLVITDHSREDDSILLK